MVSWGNLRRDSVGIQRYLVVVGPCNFLGVVEKRSPCPRRDTRFPGHGHYLQRAVVADPGRGFVTYAKSLNGSRAIAVKPTRRIAFGNRRPKIEPERERGGRKCIASRVVRIGIGAAQRIHQVRQMFRFAVRFTGRKQYDEAYCG